MLSDTDGIVDTDGAIVGNNAGDESKEVGLDV